MGLKELSLVLLVAAAFASTADSKVVVCYLGSWANYRPGDAKFLIENIDATKCTHAMYGFAKLQNNQITAYDPYLDLKENWGLGAYQRFNALKQKNPELKTLIAIGGWNEGSTKYSAMAADASARATFVKSCVDFCEKYGFDGVDMDWEYPANRGGAPEDKQNFVTLLKEMREAFDPKGYLLTAAVAAGVATIDSAYDIPQVSKYLHFINLMAYDLHGSWESSTGHNAPLHARDSESEADKKLNVEFATNYWINKGCPRDKLVLGMGSYGRSFTLASASNNGLGAPTTGPGRAGEMTKEPGMLGYNEICLYVKNQGWNVVTEDKVESPYATKDNQWVGYDDVASIEKKCDFANKENLAGVMMWSLETDDFRGRCDGSQFPLLTAMNQKMNRNVEVVTVPENEVITAGPTTTRDPNQPDPEPGVCEQEGHFRDPDDCNKYYQCVDNGNGQFTRYDFSCPTELVFDETTKTCNYKNQVPGC